MNIYNHDDLDNYIDYQYTKKPYYNSRRKTGLYLEYVNLHNLEIQSRKTYKPTFIIKVPNYSFTYQCAYCIKHYLLCCFLKN